VRPSADQGDDILDVSVLDATILLGVATAIVRAPRRPDAPAIVMGLIESAHIVICGCIFRRNHPDNLAVRLDEARRRLAERWDSL
jgi:hypothetical protein